MLRSNLWTDLHVLEHIGKARNILVVQTTEINELQNFNE